MGFFYGAIVEATPDELKDNDAFPFQRVLTTSDCAWVGIDGYYIEDEIPQELATLSGELGKRVIGFTGSNTALWTFIKVFRDGHCVRTLELSEDGWRVDGAEQDFESRFFDVREDYLEVFEDEDDSPTHVAIETRTLQTGSRIPMIDDEYFSRALGLGPIVWGGGEKVAVREQKKGFFARFFGGR